MLRTLFLFIVVFSYSLTYSQNELPKYKQGIFSTSGNCAFCHNNEFGANTLKGKDVSQSSMWRSTMMGNASKDPFFRAKADAEFHNVKNPDIKKAASDLCLKCHAPMGFTQSVFDGKNKNYFFDNVEKDVLAKDAVSCTLCHQIQPSNLGKPESFAGNYIIGKERVIFGPYKDVLTMPMSNHEDFLPQYGEHLNKSELCATCHTVITPKINKNEEVTGVFYEQSAFLEWKNSGYPESGIICQSCHMPSVDDGIDIASRPPWDETKRKPFFFHQFVGGNVTLQKIFSKNTEELKLNSPSSFYSDKLMETMDNLKENSLSLSADASVKGNILEVKVKLENQTGHKLPTGIPFRRMWIHLTAKDASGKIIFESGGYDSKGNIKYAKENFGKHYNEITDSKKVQVYEAVMVGPDEKKTFSLLFVDKFLKDNRIPPSGFTKSHPSYDTCAIYGDALNDPDFNKDSKGNEGSGSDGILYKIPVSGNEFTVDVEILYQSLEPEMFDYFAKYDDSPYVKMFIKTYNNSDITPFVMKTLSLSVK